MTRLTQRDRAKRAKMMARYNARKPNSNNIAINQTSSTISSATDAEDHKDVDDSENMNSTNITPRQQQAREPFVPKRGLGDFLGAHEKREEAPGVTEVISTESSDALPDVANTDVSPPVLTSQLSPGPLSRGKARNRVAAMSVAKKKLAASRMAPKTAQKLEEARGSEASPTSSQTSPPLLDLPLNNIVTPRNSQIVPSPSHGKAKNRVAISEARKKLAASRMAPKTPKKSSSQVVPAVPPSPCPYIPSLMDDDVSPTLSSQLSPIPQNRAAISNNKKKLAASRTAFKKASVPKFDEAPVSEMPSAVAQPSPSPSNAPLNNKDVAPTPTTTPYLPSPSHTTRNRAAIIETRKKLAASRMAPKTPKKASASKQEEVPKSGVLSIAHASPSLSSDSSTVYDTAPTLISQLSPSPSRTAKSRAVAIFDAKKKLTASRNASADTPPTPRSDVYVPSLTSQLSPSPSRSSKDRAVAISDAKKKLAASRMASTPSEKETKKPLSTTMARRSDQLARMRARTRSAAPFPPQQAPPSPSPAIVDRNTGDDGVPLTPKIEDTSKVPNTDVISSLHENKAQPSPRAIHIYQVVESSSNNDIKNTSNGNRPPSQLSTMKLQRERFMRMKSTAVEKPAQPPPPLSPKPLPSPGKPLPSPRQPLPSPRESPPTTPNQQLLPSPRKVHPPSPKPSPSPRQPPPSPRPVEQDEPLLKSPRTPCDHNEISPATSYKTQRELYMQMRAMEENGLEDPSGKFPVQQSSTQLESPTHYDMLEVLSCESDTFEGISYSKSESAVSIVNPPSEEEEEIAASASEEDTHSDETEVEEIVEEVDPPESAEEGEIAVVGAAGEVAVGAVAVSESEVRESDMSQSDSSHLEMSEKEGTAMVVSELEESDSEVSESEASETGLSESDANRSELSETEVIESEVGKTESSETALNETELGKTEVSETAMMAKKDDTISHGVNTDQVVGSDVKGNHDMPSQFPDAFQKFGAVEWPADDKDAWLADAFSPTSWGSQPGLSDDDKWNESFTGCNRQNEPGTGIVAQNANWTRPANVPSVQWDSENEEHGEGIAKSDTDLGDDDADLEWDADGFSAPRNSDRAKREEIPTNNDEDEKDTELNINEAALKSASFEWDGIGENESDDSDNKIEEPPQHQNESQMIDETEGSAYYEGFGSVLDSDRLSCKESRDDDSTSCDDSNDMNSKASEGTTGTATAFDPLSMFGDLEEVSPDINYDDFPDKDVAENNTVSILPWASPNPVKRDESENIPFASLKFSIQPVSTPAKAPVPMDSPAGTESLESWWQSRYASTQNSDINSAVQEALMKRTASPTGQRADLSRLSHGVPAPISEANAPQETLVINSEQDRPSSNSENKSHQPTDFSRPPTDEDDSIFSGLEDDCAPSSLPIRQPNPVNKYNASRTRTNGVAISINETEEDIFSGVSLSSRQLSSQFPRLKESNPMKSLLDGLSPTAESQTMKLKETEAPTLQEDHINTASRLFLPDKGYGVINLQKIEHSPTANSVTSDITSSVIFGGEFTRSDFARKSSLRKHIEILETTDEADQELSAKESPNDPLIAPQLGIPPLLEEQYEEDIETMNSQKETGKEFSKNVSRGVSLMSPSTNDSATHPSNPPLLKPSQLSVNNGIQPGEESVAASRTKCSDGNTVAETVNKVKSSFLAQFACGVFAASSFAFCAADDAPAVDSPQNKAIEENVQQIATAKLHEEPPTADSPDNCGSGAIHSKTGSDGNSEEGSQSETLTKGSETILTKGSETDLTEDSETIQSKAGSDCDYGETDDDESKCDCDGDEDVMSSSTEDETCTYTQYEDQEDSVGQTEYFSEDQSRSLSSRGTATFDESTIQDENKPFGEGVSLSAQEREKWKDRTSKDSENGSTPTRTPEIKASTLAAQSNAHEKLLLYAYTALSVPPQTEIIEKGEEQKKDFTIYPAALSPEDAVIRCDAMNKIITKLSSEGMEVLKLNREKKWQTRFLTITKEVTEFNKSNDVRFGGIGSCPRGLLWVKKFDQNKEHTVVSIDKNGKGGLLFSGMRSVSVTKDNRPLSRKQRKGKFKDSFTFVLHANSNGVKREIFFRCISKEDVFSLSAGFQAIIDRIENHNLANREHVRGKPKSLSIEATNLVATTPDTPLASAKPFSPQAIASPIADDRWEV